MADTDEDLVGRALRALYAGDHYAHEAGIEIVEFAQGYAKLTMRVREDMLNGHRVCHGGRIFGLADTAFAYACNGRNDATLALNCQIEFIKPGQAGSLLTATARERTRGRKVGKYDIEVNDEHGTLIALFRGTSYSSGKPFLPE